MESSRRAFIKSAMAAAVTGSFYARESGLEAAVRSAAVSGASFSAKGELGLRIKMTRDRLMGNGIPAFSDPFVLADVSLDPAYPRRFSNYSGDLSGRYIGALSMLQPEGGTPRLDSLVRRIISFQREDGRFGDARLSFATRDIGREQMALLWGNGRLLVGLLEYNAVRPAPEVAASARRLAGFLLRVQQSCASPEVQERMTGQGASGFICFTQLIEGLALLGMQTGDRRFYDAAAGIIPWLQPRGKQHSHGYLTTLRGIVLLHQATGNPDQLRYAEKAYQDLIASPDYTIYGGVHEYFGPGSGDAEEKTRDEGCSEADFVRLGLQLWQATGRLEYLERAERCLLNELFFNQFNTGDFGHHTTYRYGYKPTESVARAWWCCTMHGLRAFKDVTDAVVTAKEGMVKINLFLDGRYTSEPVSFDLEGVAPGNREASPRLRITVRKSSPAEVALAVRDPGWASRLSLNLNGRPVASQRAGGYLVAERRWREGDIVDAVMDYRPSITARSGEALNPADIGDRPVEAAVFCGPYLLAADSGSEPDFFGEPWAGNGTDGNILRWQVSDQRGVSSRASSPLIKTAAHRHFKYVHGGWPDNYPVLLRPISEQTAGEPRALAVWFRFRQI